MGTKPTGLDAAFLRNLFDRIYVINLREREDRRREIAGQLALVGLSFDDPLVELVEAVRPDDAGDFPSIGARGCFLSHMKVLERAVQDGHESILILEDDVDWTRAALALDAAGLQPLMATDWGFLHGGLGKDGSAPGPDGLRLERLAHDAGLRLTHFIALRGAVIPTALAHLQAILTRPAGSPEGGPMHVDGAYSWLRRGHPEIAGYVCVPSVARQRPSESNIDVPTGLRSLPGVGPALSAARTLRKRLGL